MILNMKLKCSLMFKMINILLTNWLLSFVYLVMFIYSLRDSKDWTSMILWLIDSELSIKEVFLVNLMTNLCQIQQENWNYLFGIKSKSPDYRWWFI